MENPDYALDRTRDAAFRSYENLDGKVASYFLQLWEFRTPTYEVEGELYDERKCDLLKVWTSTDFEEIEL